MSDTNALKQSIIEQAHQEGKLRLAAAEDKLTTEFEANKARLLREKEAERQSQLKDINQQFQIEAQQIRNQERQSTLVSKQKVLKELFAAAKDSMFAWTVIDELAFIRKILAKYSGQAVVVTFGQVTDEKLSATDITQLQSEFPKATFENDVIAGQAGLVISIGQVDDTYLYADLIESIYKEESSRIAADIFKEN